MFKIASVFRLIFEWHLQVLRNHKFKVGITTVQKCLFRLYAIYFQ